jgi:hypothetical protein
VRGKRAGDHRDEQSFAGDPIRPRRRPGYDERQQQEDRIGFRVRQAVAQVCPQSLPQRGDPAGVHDIRLDQHRAWH